jgi:hypothetical protein
MKLTALTAVLSALALVSPATAAPLANAEADNTEVDERIFYNPTTSGSYSTLSSAHYSAWQSSARWAA